MVSRPVESVEVPIVLEVDPAMASNLLLGAINDYLGYRSHKQEHQCSKLWLFTDGDDDGDDGDDPEFISFDNVCELLDLSADRLRMNINIFQDKGKKRLFDTEMEKLIQGCRNER
jgi:hypothetical protein